MYNLEREFKLDKYGWKGCSLFFIAPTYKEMRDLQGLQLDQTVESAEKVFQFMKSKFIRGTAPDKEGTQEVKAEDLEELPFDMILDLTRYMVSGEIDENLDSA